MTGHLDVEQLLLIGTVDPDECGGRAALWKGMIERLVLQQQDLALARNCRVLTWQEVDALTSGQQVPTVSRTGPEATDCQRVLDLVGRHPCLTLRQLSGLLGVPVYRARRTRDDLIARGWLCGIPTTDIPQATTAALPDEPSGLGLSEPTPRGRSVLAGRLGLTTTLAARYHGLSGGGNSWAGRRRGLLRTLPHTLGVNDVFVSLASAARGARARGADEALEEWRSAAACERRHCKPDGYGRYRRGKASVGFFLEFDRGTERSTAYTAKFDAYYGYRDSGQSARDYDGFPWVLFVTTNPTAEHRIAEAARRAWARRGGQRLAVLTTRADLIAHEPAGLLGPIWRTPYPGLAEPGSGQDRRERIFTV
jgi:hypothetical protein